jgi:hypothetical protein
MKQVACYVVVLVSYLPHSSTLKMEAVCSSETSLGFQRTIRHDIPEDRNLQSHQLLAKLNV